MLENRQKREYVAFKRSPLTVVYWAESFNDLVRYLDEAGRGAGGRILRILEGMLEMDAKQKQRPVLGETETERELEGDFLVSRRGKSVLNPRLKTIAPEKYKRELELMKNEEWLDRELARYRFHLRARPGLRWSVSWRIESRSRRFRNERAALNDGQALRMILDLAQAGLLKRLRRCGHCRNWLYAKFRHQEFCSTKCQQKHYGGSEEWKAHRRAYMRDYYQRNFAKRKESRP